MILDHLDHGINLRNFRSTPTSPYLAFIDSLMALSFIEGRPAGGVLRRWRLFPAAGLARALSAKAGLIVAEIDPVVTQAAIRRITSVAAAGAKPMEGKKRLALRNATSDRLWVRWPPKDLATRLSDDRIGNPDRRLHFG